MLSTIILGLDLCVGKAAVKHQQRLWLNPTIYKGAWGLGSEASESQKGSVLMEGVRVSEESV